MLLFLCILVVSFLRFNALQVSLYFWLYSKKGFKLTVMLLFVLNFEHATENMLRMENVSSRNEIEKIKLLRLRGLEVNFIIRITLVESCVTAFVWVSKINECVFIQRDLAR